MTSAKRPVAIGDAQSPTQPPAEDAGDGDAKKRHACYACNKRFRYPSQLKLHYGVHSTVRAFPCDQCGCTFKYASTLREHALTHVTARPYACGVCGLAFAYRGNCRVHARTHEGAQGAGADDFWRRFKCDKCPAVFKYKSNLREHVNAQHADGGKFPCVSCGRVYRYRSSLLNHMRGHRRRRNHRPHKCGICSLAFAKAGRLRQHAGAHKPGDAQRFKCARCPRAFPRRCQLSLHSLVHAFERRHACDACGRVFRLRKCLAQHVGLVHRPPAAIECRHCHRLIKGGPAGMRAHAVTHGEREKFGCYHCGRTYLRRISLQRHLVAVHNLQVPRRLPQAVLRTCQQSSPMSPTKSSPPPPPPPEALKHRFECQQCGKVFVQRYNLQRHARRLHNSGNISSVKFECAECGVSCRDAEKLAEHRRVHTGKGGGGGRDRADARPFACGRCPARFRWARNLKEHAGRMHSGEGEGESQATASTGEEEAAAAEKPKHVCAVCGKGFGVRSHLLTHSRAHTEERPFPCDTCGAAYKHKKNLTAHFKREHSVTLGSDSESDISRSSSSTDLESTSCESD